MDGKIKPWQIALFVVAILAVLGTTVLSMGSDEPRLTKRVLLVDVTTGQLFEKNTNSGAAVIPELNPETGKATLLPVDENPPKTFTVEKRFLDSLERDVKPTVINPDGTVKVAEGRVRTLTAPKK